MLISADIATVLEVCFVEIEERLMNLSDCDKSPTLRPRQLSSTIAAEILCADLREVPNVSRSIPYMLQRLLESYHELSSISKDSCR